MKYKITKKQLKQVYLIEKHTIAETAQILNSKNHIIYLLLKKYKLSRGAGNWKASKNLEKILSFTILNEEYIERQLSIRTISIKYKISASSIRNLLKKYKIPLRTTSEIRQIDLEINKTYGLLTVLYKIKRHSTKNPVLWKCQCKCGKLVKKTAWYITRKGNYPSCGCGSQHRSYTSPLFTGHEEITGALWSRIKASAKKRKLEFNITIEYIYSLYIKQNKLCALTKVPIIFNKTAKETCKRTASLDRIDCNKGYVIDNVQWVHKHINRIKQCFNNEELIYFSTIISQNNSIDINNPQYKDFLN